MKITYKFNNDNGTYLCFGEFEYEEDFPRFLAGISERFNITEPEPRQGPYSVTADFVWLESNLIAMFHEDTGCCIVVPIDSSKVVEEIERLMGKAKGVGPIIDNLA